MKYTAAIAALIANVAAVKDCRTDKHCKTNWYDTKCCGDFECHSSCNKRKCRISSCGLSKCGKKASNFKNYRKKGALCTWSSSDDDYHGWGGKKVTSLQGFVDPPVNEPPTEGHPWISRQVNCTKPNSKGMFKCNVSDGFARVCKKDGEGRIRCQDSDGHHEYCRIRNGFMTCSDRDHPAWWQEEVPAPPAPGHRWVKEKVACKKNAAGKLIC